MDGLWLIPCISGWNEQIGSGELQERRTNGRRVRPPRYFEGELIYWDSDADADADVDVVMNDVILFCCFSDHPRPLWLRPSIQRIGRHDDEDDGGRWEGKGRLIEP